MTAVSVSAEVSSAAAASPITANASPNASPNASASAAVSATASAPPRQALPAAALAALGVVFGDIGTSPLYTLKEVFMPATGVTLTPANLVGSVSTIFWALMLVVTLKYVLLVLRADNRGEGGVLALTALATQGVTGRPRLRAGLLLLGMAGATLFYGDSIITPAISVLGAMEGLSVISPAFNASVLPLSLAVLVGLFALQSRGTAAVGRWFGPVILLWFAVLAVTGVQQIAQQPAILAALNPLRAAEFLAARGWQVLAAVGAIVLALTGAEALYADLGHFGRRPIQWAWCALVMPALALNYLGQGALLMSDPAAIENPFFHLFSPALRVPAVVLATLAAIIASQAVISGAFSLSRQAIALGFLPRLNVRHTSAAEAGQIYLPAVNGVLLLGVLGAVLGFGSSTALAGAYGIAVTLTMAITTVLAGFVLQQRLGMSRALAITASFLALDLLLVAGCAVKLFDGGWFPLAVGLGLLLLMRVWQLGRAGLAQRQQLDAMALEPFIAMLASDTLPRSTRSAVYLVADTAGVPQALLHNLKHNQVLHASNLVVTAQVHDQPWVPVAERAQVQALGHGFWRVQLNFGFMDNPDVPQALADAAGLGTDAAPGLALNPTETSYFLSRETLVPIAGSGLHGLGSRLASGLFVAMSRHAGSAALHFGLPDNSVVELGARLRL